MQQNDRYFTFLISHFFRSRIFFKRISISKKVLQNGALASAAVIAISTLSIGLIGVFGNSISFDKTLAWSMAFRQLPNSLRPLRFLILSTIPSAANQRRNDEQGSTDAGRWKRDGRRRDHRSAKGHSTTAIRPICHRCGRILER